MTDFFSAYGLFLAKTVTLVAALLFVMAAAAANRQKGKKAEKGTLLITHLNKEIDALRDEIRQAVQDKDVFKREVKAEKKQQKMEHRARKKSMTGDAPADTDKKRVYVIDFEGDTKASEVDSMRKVITAVLAVARPGLDEVLLRLESTGGMVHSYGLAASQLERIRHHQIRLTICVDKVAASGGYMMACLGDRIFAAPFAILGSVGVLMQLPNFHRLLKDNKVDFEMITAGEYKRTLTIFGENTEKGREKMEEDIQDVHILFKDFIRSQRPALDVDKIATGETWFGTRALALNLVDELKTSDECILTACADADVFGVVYQQKKNLSERLNAVLEHSIVGALSNWVQKVSKTRYFS
ncbi:MAG: protease SohB [Pseudomonadales bacterium]|nr:protease SohB [Pseudomonadales bacterium]